MDGSGADKQAITLLARPVWLDCGDRSSQNFPLLSSSIVNGKVCDMPELTPRSCGEHKEGRPGLWPSSVAWYGILYSGAVSVLAVSGQPLHGVPLPRWQPRLPQFVPRLAPFARGGNNNTPINTWSCVNSISINGHSPLPADCAHTGRSELTAELK